MNYKAIFGSSLFVAVLVNLIMSTISTTYTLLTLQNFVGFIAGLVLSLLVLGLNTVVVSLSDTTIKMISSILMILNLMFQVDVVSFHALNIDFTFSVGLGLISNVLNLFLDGDFFGLGTMLVGLLAILIFISGIMMINEDM